MMQWCGIIWHMDQKKGITKHPTYMDKFLHTSNILAICVPVAKLQTQVES